MNEDRQKSMDIAMSELEKAFGKGVLMRFGDKAASNSIEVIPTGSLGLDIALGVGGLPRGRIIEIYGPESSGKTTLTLHIIAEVQKLGGVAVFVDAEHALDPTYAKSLGVNIDDLYISQPDDGEQALDVVDMMVRSGAVDLVVVDSVAALVPRAEIEGDMGSSHVGLHARLMSQALRKITAFGSRSRCIVLFTNQLREKIGVIYGSNEVTTGGRALKFYASVRMDIRKTETLKAGDEQVANRTRVKVVKNKVAPPFRQCEFDIVFGKGISKEGDVLDLATDLDIVMKSGSWYNYKDQRLGQGRENAKIFLHEHPEITLELENAVRAAHGLNQLDDLDKMREAFMSETTESRMGKSEKKGGKKKKTAEKPKKDDKDADEDEDGADE